MSSFPKLKTGAIAQYPSTRGLAFSNRTVRFIDGGEQRFRTHAAPSRQWEVGLDILDESEMGRLEQFFLENQGTFGTFTFVDPWDGTEYPNCSLDAGTFEFSVIGESRSRTKLVIRENVV